MSVAHTSLVLTQQPQLLSHSMHITAVHFDAYRSLLGKSLTLSDRCTSLVGINESGKSNILKALAVLSPSNPLTAADTPKMGKKVDPHVRFSIVLNDNSRRAIESAVARWENTTSLLKRGVDTTNCSATYHVTFSRDRQEEVRYFTIEGCKFDKHLLVLRLDTGDSGRRINIRRESVPLSEAVLITPDILRSNAETMSSFAQLQSIRNEAMSIRRSIAALLFKSEADEPDGDDPDDDEEEGDEDEDEDEDEENEDDGEDEEDEEDENGQTKDDDYLINASSASLPSIDAIRLIDLQDKLKQCRHMEEQFCVHLAHNYDLGEARERLEQRIEQLNENIVELTTRIAETEKTIAGIEPLRTQTDEQKKTLINERKALGKFASSLKTAQAAKASTELDLEDLIEPLESLYSDTPESFAARLGDELHSVLSEQMPKVVSWQYSDDYVLQGETVFKGISGVKELNDISRPLVNLFRIGLEATTLADVKEKIQDIQRDGGERTKYQTQMNRRLKAYLSSVWPSYDQELHISLEQERIRVQFFDPKCDDASYFDMQERSQGCQTFISFLLTVGAEAKNGVITNTLLLLDEPETHLHPSGVRYMLKELIKASQCGNTVVFATHSVFMIDQENYDRHVIVQKESEHTVIQPSSSDRIGYFMQEELLYSALDVNPALDFSTRHKFNFVFEGHGDAVLFEHFWNKALRLESRPFELKSTSFYQGGKCSDIKKYFSSSPIQLGATWVFILDSDKPANDLRSYIESRYRDFLGTYIFVFQYTLEDGRSGTEIEDLLPFALLTEAFSEAAEKCGITADLEGVDESSKFADKFVQAFPRMPDQELVKATLKDAINNAIKRTVREIKSKDDADRLIPRYSAWAANVAECLQNKRRESGSARAKPSPKQVREE